MNVNFRGFRVEDDRKIFKLTATRNLDTPLIKSTKLPPASKAGGVGGGLAYDTVTKRPYYSDGFTWFPIGTGVVGGSSIESYGFVKIGAQSIIPNTPTIINPWESVSLPVYSTIPQWNLATGVYTASTDESLSLGVNISWSKGVSHLGDRTLRVRFQPLGVGPIFTVREMTTQANPNINVETTQELYTHVQLKSNDKIFTEVDHTASTTISLSGGKNKAISGYRVSLS